MFFFFGGGGVSEVSTKAVILVHLKISEPRNVVYNEDFLPICDQ